MGFGLSLPFAVVVVCSVFAGFEVDDGFWVVVDVGYFFSVVTTFDVIDEVDWFSAACSV